MNILKLILTLIVVAFSIYLITSIENVASDDLIIVGNGNGPIYTSNTDSGRFDFSNDGLADYYVRAHFTGNENQSYKVHYKIQDDCVDGNNFADAKMKMGFTTLAPPSERVWITEDITLWNSWFKSKKNDDNGIIDLVSFLPGTSLSYPSGNNGEDAIQGIENKKHGSFTHRESIKELGGQSGWEGYVFFNVPQGEYLLWTIHPASGLGGCDRLAGLGIPIIIDS